MYQFSAGQGLIRPGLAESAVPMRVAYAGTLRGKVLTKQNRQVSGFTLARITVARQPTSYTWFPINQQDWALLNRCCDDKNWTRK